MSIGWVYFALQEDDRRWEGRMKIGWAKNPMLRLKELQVGNPFPLKLIGMCCGSKDDEHWAHERLGSHRTGGEWFLLGDAWEVIAFWANVEGTTLGDVVGFALDALENGGALDTTILLLGKEAA